MYYDLMKMLSDGGTNVRKIFLIFIRDLRYQYMNKGIGQ